MLLGFKNQFVEPINLGIKKHTIREDKNNLWRVGMKIHMATGVRTKNLHKFREETCLGLQTIEIKWKEPDELLRSLNEPYWTWGRSVRVLIDGVIVTGVDEIIDSLALNDGFKDRDDFFKWFCNDFTGKIIHWTELKYKYEWQH